MNQYRLAKKSYNYIPKNLMNWRTENSEGDAF